MKQLIRLIQWINPKQPLQRSRLLTARAHTAKPLNLARYLPLLSAMAVLVLLAVGCNEETNLGFEVLPPGDNVELQYSDTSTVRVFTLTDDSVRTAETSVSLLGSINDPVFGISRTELLTQITLPSTSVTDFDAIETIDSLVVFMSYVSDTISEADYYGDITQMQTIDVFRLQEDMVFDSAYYSNTPAENFIDPANPLMQLNYLPGGQDTAWQFTLPQQVVDDFQAGLSEGVFENSETFVDFFKGLCFRPQQVASGGSIVKFDLYSGESKMVMYYRTETDTLSSSFYFGIESARFNTFYHDHSATSFYDAINDTIQQDSVAYMQGLSGLRLKVELPYIQNFGKIAVNRAVLQVKAVEGAWVNTDFYPIPKNLVVVKLEDGEETGLDEYYSNGTYYSITYNDDDMAYNIDITWYIQRLLQDGDTGTDLIIKPSKTAINPDRAIITTGAHSNPMKLLITYTLIE